MRLPYHGGQILLSQVTAELVRESLPQAATLRDLGAHRLKDLDQPEHLFQFGDPDLPCEFPPLRSLEAFAHNLPRQLTSFIGRERERDEVKRFLATTALVTLTGTGGCGKTRLALQVAADLVAEFADGVWLVELAGIADPALVPQAVASALGVREEPGRLLEATLTEYLRPRSLLLVLDNCEHLISACAHLVDSLLRACPKLRILASSREGLGIAGEQAYRVPSLALPDPRDFPPLEQLQEFAAVGLFVDRAVLCQHSFALTSANAAPVIEICRRLDGIPLAIEMAAARVKAIPVEELARRLDDRFRLLTGGSRTSLPRQRTLRATIDWSHELLSEPERVLLRRLSVFAGGWTLAAAEAVCQGAGIAEWQIVDLLTSLVEKSLVVCEEQQEGRYRLLETIRDYGGGRLLEAGETELMRRAHRNWFVAFAERAEPELHGPDQVAWFGRLERDQENMRAALQGSKTAADGPELGLRLACALRWFWWVRGHVHERQEWLESLLAVAGRNVSPAVRAKALTFAGELAWRQGNLEKATACAEESLAVFRALGDQQGMASALWELGEVARVQRDDERATALWEEHLGLNRQLGDQRGIASALYALGVMAANRGEYERATNLGEESLALSQAVANKGGMEWAYDLLQSIALRQGAYHRAAALSEQGLMLARELGNRGLISHFLLILSQVALYQREYPRAIADCEESLAVARELKRGEAPVISRLHFLGVVSLHSKEYEQASVRFQESLSVSRRLGEQPSIASSLFYLAIALRHQQRHEEAQLLVPECLGLFRDLAVAENVAKSWHASRAIIQCLRAVAGVAAVQGRFTQMAMILGASESLMDVLGVPLHGAIRADYELWRAQGSLTEEDGSAAWAEGRSMGWDEAMAHALAAPSPGGDE